jgi:outer membrane biosynthesis protein TonB
MQVMNNQSDSRTRTALGSLEFDTKKKMESFKVKGVAYQEFQTEDPGSKGRMLPRVGNEIPSQPAYTSWSGLLRCAPNSPFAARLMEKCGGVAIGNDDAEFTEADANKKAEEAAEEAKKKAAQEKPAQEKPAQEKPAQEKPAQEKPAEEKKVKSDQEKAAEKKKEELALWLKSINSEADKKKAAEAKKEATRWWRSATAVIGYWTAPEDWREMLDGNEPPTPCSEEDYPKQSFQPSWS